MCWAVISLSLRKNDVIISTQRDLVSFSKIKSLCKAHI